MPPLRNTRLLYYCGLVYHSFFRVFAIVTCFKFYEFANNFLVEEEDLNSSTEKEGVEVFFFPDESNMRQKHTSSETTDKPIENDKTIDHTALLLGVLEEAIEAKPTNAQVAKDLGDPTSTPKGTPKKSKRKKVKETTFILSKKNVFPSVL